MTAKAGLKARLFRNTTRLQTAAGSEPFKIFLNANGLRKVRFRRNSGSLVFDSHGLLALAVAEVVELCPADAAWSFYFDLCNARRMDGENAFNAFAIRNPSNGEHGIESGTFAANDDAGENLDAFLVAFDDTCVDPDTVAHVERGDRLFKLLRFDFLDNAAHNDVVSGLGDLKKGKDG